MTPSHETVPPPPGEPMPPGVMAVADDASHSPLPERVRVSRVSGRPDWRFLVASPWHFVALGCGSGLPRFAPGTWGTAFAWASFVLLDRWLSDVGWAVLLAFTIPIGIVAAQRTGDRLGSADSSHIVIDEIVAFWAVLWMLPAAASGWIAALAFALFRMFDIAKPAPIRRLDARLKNGFGVMLDDLVAALYTLLLVAIYWRLAHG